MEWRPGGRALSKLRYALITEPRRATKPKPKPEPKPKAENS